VECAAESDTGEITGINKVANVHALFTGCTLLGVIPCQTPGLGAGEIQTSTLKGKLGYIKKSPKEVGLLLEPSEAHGKFSHFECGAFHVYVGMGDKKTGTEFVKGVLFPGECWGKCPGATPEEEKYGGYDQVISPITPFRAMTGKFEQMYVDEPSYPFKNIPDRFYAPAVFPPA
jgi:hypothetical protein